MSDQDRAAALLHNARREARTVMIVWAVALVWVVGYCYTRGYEHVPDVQRPDLIDEEPRPEGEKFYRNPAEGFLVRVGLARPRTGDNFSSILGMPDWVFFGILVPWIACSLFTVWFALYGIRDDDLGREAEGGPTDGH